MKQFQMKDVRTARKLYNKIKLRYPRWSKFRWLWYGLWTAFIVSIIVFSFYTHDFYGGFTSNFFYDLFLFVVCMGIIAMLTMPILYAFLIVPSGEVSMVIMWHSVTLDGKSLISDWLPYPMQTRNVGGDHVITTFPYENIQRIIWNERLQRLEIYGDYIQKVHQKDFFKDEWVPKERTYLTLCKKKKVLCLYNYFQDMEELITCLETESGCTVEKCTDGKSPFWE